MHAREIERERDIYISWPFCMIFILQNLGIKWIKMDYRGVSIDGGAPKSSIFIGFSHPGVLPFVEAPIDCSLQGPTTIDQCQAARWV